MAKRDTRLSAEEVSALVRAGDGDPDPVEIRRVEFAELDPEEGNGSGAALSFLWDIPMAVEVVLGSTALTVKEILQVTPGSVIELDRAYGDLVDVHLNGRLVARGEVVLAGEQFGVKIKELLVSSEELASEEQAES